MRILIVTPQYLPDVSGSTLLLQSMVHHLTALGHVVEVLTYTDADHSQDADYDQVQPYKIHRVVSRRGYAASSVAMLTRLTALLLGRRYDLMLAGFAFPSAILANLACQLTGVPFAVYSHGEDATCVLETPWKCRALSQALRHSRVVLANSHFTAETIRTLGVEAERTLWMPPGVDTTPFTRVSAERIEELRAGWNLAGKRVLVTVARLEPRKGQDAILRAMPDLLRTVPNAHYLIAGKGDAEPLLALARELGIEAHVTLAGFVAEEDLAALYTLSDVHIMTSRWDHNSHHVEGFGIVYLEAALCGRPSIAGTAGGCADAVEDGVTGYLVDPESISEIAAALKKVLADPLQAAHMGRMARLRVLREFDRADMLCRLEQVLYACTRPAPKTRGASTAEKSSSSFRRAH